MKLRINESNNGSMTFEEFKEKMEEVYHSKFPDSLCSVKLIKMLGRAIVINCFLANDKSECPHGYFDNDMFKICFWIHDMPRDFEVTDIMPETLTLTNSSSQMFIVPPNNFYAYGSVKIPFRKVTGNADKIIATFTKYVDKLYSIVNQQISENKIHYSYIDIVNNKIR